MNVSEAKFSATWCAPTCTAPSVPMMSAQAMNRPDSLSIVPQMGRPSRKTSRNRTKSGFR